MFGQMTAGCWIYIGTQGILQGTYQTFAAAGEKHFGSADLSRADDPHRRPRRDGRGAAARRDDGRRGDPLHRGRPDADRAPARDALPRRGRRLARRRARAGAGGGAARAGRSRSGCSAMPPRSCRNWHKKREPFDLVTDQTAAHDPLTGYVPAGLAVEEAASLRASDPDEYLRRARESIAAHVEAMLEYVRAGSYVFDYGNNLRGEAREAGVAEAFSYPGFVPAYIRPLFCRGIGPFRWAALSGDPADIAAIDEELRRALPRRRAAPALARARSRARRLPGAAGADLLARLRRPRQGGSRDQRARPHRRGLGSGRDRPRPPRLRLGRFSVPRDRGDARRLRRDRGLADPERARQHGGGRDVGQRPPRRRRRDRQLDPRRHGRPRRRQRRRGRAARAGADDRSGHGRHAARRRRLRRGARRGARARTRSAQPRPAPGLDPPGA